MINVGQILGLMQHIAFLEFSLNGVDGSKMQQCSVTHVKALQVGRYVSV